MKSLVLAIVRVIASQYTRLVVIAALLLMVACSEDVVLPEAKPLQATEQQLAQLYKLETGPYAVLMRKDIVFGGADDSEQVRALAVSVSFPDAPGSFPLLLFSHGNWSDRDSYDRVISHWVSHGYVVIAPDHLDCCSMFSGIVNSVRYGQFGLIDERMKDFSFLLDNLDRLQDSVDGLAGKIDSSRIAATGHSFGAFSAEQFGGAGTFNPGTQSMVYYRDERIKAIVALSPPGPMFDVINDQSWLELNTPTLVTTGTWDSNAQFWPDWRLHKMSFDTAKKGHNYALITQGADHYLGNLICRQAREQTPQHDALKMLNSTSTAFLDAYIKDDPVARAYIDSEILAAATGGFSIIQRR